MPAKREVNLSGILAVLLAALLWGTTGTAATFAPAVSALAIGAAAMGIGGLLQAIIVISPIYVHRYRLRQQGVILVVGALTVAIYPLAFYASMRYAGVTIGTVISLGSAPLLAALLEYWLDGDRLTRRWLLSVILGVAGMLFISVAKSPASESATIDNRLIGLVLGLLAGLTYAFYTWCARRLMQRAIPARVAMGALFGAGGLLLMPILLWTGGPLLTSSRNLTVGLYMACFPMFLGYLCFGYALARIRASYATTLTLLEPVVATCLAIIIVGERLSLLGWIGISLIIACLVVITVSCNQRAAHLTP